MVPVFACLNVLIFTIFLPGTVRAAAAQLLGWNNLGMHCMDSDYSVFSILPPYNTVECQLIVNGKLVTNGSGYSVTYQAVADPLGSINSTSIGKGTFYLYAKDLYGASLLPESGLAGWSMPGVSNTPQSMLFEQANKPAANVTTPVNWFRAEGIPLTPFDDAGKKNTYPLMRLIARNAANQAIATNDIVLPVSDEMDCRLCHASGTDLYAMPGLGWVYDGSPERDYRLNILRLHDDFQFALHSDLYGAALAARGINPQGLYRSVVADNKPVLCASCHASEALGTASFGTIPPLTASIHGFHAHVIDPITNTNLDSSANRESCYRCHPGSTTRCLRGAMGSSIASDGSMSMQCQSCHGNLSAVGSTNRIGWFMEPNCQSCHSGTAIRNSGQIRYTSAFDANGLPRVPADNTFATTPNAPAKGLSLFRFSAGHGGLQCEACHGSTHAEFPSSHPNDNVRNQAIQGHAGVTVECTTCHASTPNTPNGGPHGMHAIGQGWITGSGGVTKHADWIENIGGTSYCTTCHGTDYRGTVLSRTKGNRSFNVSLDGGRFTLNLFQGAEVGCYLCHRGIEDSQINSIAAPALSNLSTNTSNDMPVTMMLNSVSTGLRFRIVSQPANGSAGLSNNIATYYPRPGFVGADSFTFAAYDGSKNSNLATASVSVTQGAFSFGLAAFVPARYPAGWPVAFRAMTTLSNIDESVSIQWDFGSGASPTTNQIDTYVYSSVGTYNWKVTATVRNSTANITGTITITDPIKLAGSISGGLVTLSWPNSMADAILESTPTLDSSALWRPVTNSVLIGADFINVKVPNRTNSYFRLKRAW